MTSSLQTQMCVNTKHFYIFEPIETYSKQICIPIFFCLVDGKLYAKCVIPTLRMTTQSSYQLIIPSNIDFNNPTLLRIKTKEFDKVYSEIKQNNQLLLTICANKIFEVQIDLPNSWRKKARGKVLQNLPISLYADDTLGKSSKHWNKHMSFYYTLAGLPPNLSNQEYNCHFIATSNHATVLKISEHLVDELK
jgi:hypothetical protein